MIRNGIYAQKLDEVSTTLKGELGEPRWANGNKFVYSQNSAASALRLGEVLIRDPSEGVTHYSFDDVVSNVAAVGNYAISQTITATAGDTIVAGEFAGLDVYVDLGLGKGQAPGRIESNTGAASAASFTIYLTAALGTALTAAGHSDITIIPRDVVTLSVASTAKQDVVGLAPLAVVASGYFWRQVSGIGPMYIGDASAHNCIVCPNDDTAGQVVVVGSAVTVEDVTVCGITINGTGTADELAYVRLRGMDS